MLPVQILKFGASGNNSINISLAHFQDKFRCAAIEISSLNHGENFKRGLQDISEINGINQMLEQTTCKNMIGYWIDQRIGMHSYHWL